jgi:tetratricopeptide (TPR) repeat protein
LEIDLMTRQIARIYLPVIAVALLLVWSSVGTGRAGLSRMMSEYGSAMGSLQASEKAVSFDPLDPEAHHVYGRVAADNGDPNLAVAQVEQAVKLRPNDYFLWYELGRLQDENGDSESAVSSLRRATELAPHYSQPRWLLGNVLLRNEDVDTAFAELRRATRNDPTMFPQLLDLAWGIFEGNIDRVVQTIQPATDSEQVTVRRRIMTELIAVKDYQAARNFSGLSCDGLCNQGFEDPILTNEEGFGWQPMALTQTVKVLADTAQPAEGSRSLRVEYSGNFDESTAVVTQLVPVSQGHYRLTWKSRTNDLLSAGLPVIAISDTDGRELARSGPLAKGTSGWTEYSVEFETAETTKAVKLTLQRDPCNVNPCPITGRAWFDQFALISN